MSTTQINNQTHLQTFHSPHGRSKKVVVRDTDGNITHQSSRIFLKNLKSGDAVLTPAGERFVATVETVQPTKWWVSMNAWNDEMPVAEYTITWVEDKEPTVHKAENARLKPAKITVLRPVTN